MSPDYKPTPTHCFLKLLHDKGVLRRVFTQNIDALEIKAGLCIIIIISNYATIHHHNWQSFILKVLGPTARAFLLSFQPVFISVCGKLHNY